MASFAAPTAALLAMWRLRAVTRTKPSTEIDDLHLRLSRDQIAEQVIAQSSEKLSKSELKRRIRKVQKKLKLERDGPISRKGRRKHPSSDESSPCTRKCVDDKSASHLELFGGKLLGKEKWLGGAMGRDGFIYGIPGHSREVLRINPKTSEVQTFGSDQLRHWEGLEGETKWLRCYVAPSNGCIYDSVLQIDPSKLTDEGEPTLTLLKPEPGSETEKQLHGRWKFHGAVVGKDGNIYCIPCNATRVLKIEPQRGELSVFGDSSLMQGRQKWYGGLMGVDGNVYCIPQNAASVLVIMPMQQGVRIIGTGLFPQGGWKWHGGTYTPKDQCIYGYPNNADRVIRINPQANGGQGGVTLIGDEKMITGGEHRRDGKYKFDGGVVGSDGNLYCIPGDTDRVLKIIPPETSEGAAKLEIMGRSFAGEERCHNKWQNGFLGRDKCIYAIPLKSDAVLKIDVETQEVSAIYPPTGAMRGLDKWQGGVVAPDGNMYCMPCAAKSVLKITPGPAV